MNRAQPADVHGSTLPRSVRIGYGSGSVATGTAPGLMLLPSH